MKLKKPNEVDINNRSTKKYITLDEAGEEYLTHQNRKNQGLLYALMTFDEWLQYWNIGTI